MDAEIRTCRLLQRHCMDGQAISRVRIRRNAANIPRRRHLDTTNSGTTAVLNNACGRGDQTVVVGNAGTVLSSSDCVSWNPCVVNLTRSESFSGLFQSNGTFYAVGSDVIASTDGISWTSLGREVQTPIYAWLHRIRGWL